MTSTPQPRANKTADEGHRDGKVTRERNTEASASPAPPRERGGPYDELRRYKRMARELDAIVNGSSDGLFVCDAAGTVIRMNPASERIHRVKAQEIVGRNMEDLLAEGFIDHSAALEALSRRETLLKIS